MDSEQKSVAHQRIVRDVVPSLFDNPLWDIQLAAQKLAVSDKTLRDWVYKRQIPFKKVGSLIRFDPSEILQWIEDRSPNYGN